MTPVEKEMSRIRAVCYDEIKDHFMRAVRCDFRGKRNYHGHYLSIYGAINDCKATSKYYNLADRKRDSYVVYLSYYDRMGWLPRLSGPSLDITFIEEEYKYAMQVFCNAMNGVCQDPKGIFTETWNGVLNLQSDDHPTGYLFSVGAAKKYDELSKIDKERVEAGHRRLHT